MLSARWAVSLLFRISYTTLSALGMCSLIESLCAALGRFANFSRSFSTSSCLPLLGYGRQLRRIDHLRQRLALGLRDRNSSWPRRTPQAIRPQVSYRDSLQGPAVWCQAHSRSETTQSSRGSYFFLALRRRGFRRAFTFSRSGSASTSFSPWTVICLSPFPAADRYLLPAAFITATAAFENFGCAASTFAATSALVLNRVVALWCVR